MRIATQNIYLRFIEEEIESPSILICILYKYNFSLIQRYCKHVEKKEQMVAKLHLEMLL